MAIRKSDDLHGGPPRRGSPPPASAAGWLQGYSLTRLLHVLSRALVPQADRFLGEPPIRLRRIRVHLHDVVWVGLCHPLGERLPHLIRELRGSPIQQGVDDLSIVNLDVPEAAMEWTEAHLIRSDVLEVERALDDRPRG